MRSPFSETISPRSMTVARSSTLAGSTGIPSKKMRVSGYWRR